MAIVAKVSFWLTAYVQMIENGLMRASRSIADTIQSGIYS